MFRSAALFTMTIALVVGVGFSGGVMKAQDKKAAAEEKAIEAKAQPYSSAATVAFGDKLGLPFPSLLTLGTRIEQARREADPVGLMVAAQELAIAEKVSEKKAELTSDVLAKEAVALVKARGRSVELKALALMTSDADGKKDLETAIQPAKDQEAKVAEAVKTGERMRGIDEELVVYNKSHHTVQIYVNGRHVGHVHAHSHGHFHVHTHGHTDLKAVGGGLRWDSHVEGNYRSYSWSIRE